MCVLPDVSLAEPSSSFVEEGMVCPMDGTTMCPPSAVSSPERQGKQGSFLLDSQATFVRTVASDFSIPSLPMLVPWGSEPLPVVFISISASSVLRI